MSILGKGMVGESPEVSSMLFRRGRVFTVIMFVFSSQSGSKGFHFELCFVFSSQSGSCNGDVRRIELLLIRVMLVSSCHPRICY